MQLETNPPPGILKLTYSDSELKFKRKKYKWFENRNRYFWGGFFMGMLFFIAMIMLFFDINVDWRIGYIRLIPKQITINRDLDEK